MTAAEHKTVFYPLNLPKNGYVYGWKLSQRVLCVAGTILCSSHTRAQAFLQEALEVDEWKEVTSPEMQPCVLGKSSLSEGHPEMRLENETSGQFDIFCLIFYRRQERSRMRFYTIEPLELDVTAGGAGREIDLLTGRMRMISRSDLMKPAAMFPRPSLPVDQMNIAFELDDIVQRVVSGQFPAHSSAMKKPIVGLAPISRIFTHSKGIYDICISAAYFLCNLPAPPFPFNGTRLKDLSLSVQQLDVRLEQAIFLPKQFHLFQSQNHDSTAYFAAHYISFNNCVWLILNDAIVGIAFGTFLLENSEFLGQILYHHTRWLTVHLIRDALGWLDHWPAGLKLNTELSRFLCLCFLSLTDFWGSGLDISASYFPIIIRVIGIMGRSGMTMVLSLFSDLLSLLTGHLYLSYLISTAIFSRQLSVAHSLWNLFRGKRHNVLRNRTDSWDYDIDQLLLGTILFTLVAFLFPTVLVYYVLFAVARLVIILIHATLETLLAFMNHFPLFTMMLRVKDPYRLPGGVYFVTQAPYGALTLQNLPISFSRIFFQHLRVWSRLSAHYHPLRLLRCLVTGTPLTQIARYSIRYSMIRGLSGSTNADRS